MSGQTDKGGIVWRLTPDLLCILDATGVFRDANPAWEQTLGWTVAEMESAPFFDFLHPDDFQQSMAAFQRALAGLPVLGFENRYRHRDGSYRWLTWNAIPEGDMFYCTARDITADKDNQTNLAEVEDEARMREEFIAVLSHDLRNPLTAISAIARMVKRETESEDMLQLLDEAQQSVFRMSALIDDVTDFAQVRLGGGLRTERDPHATLHQTLEETIQEMRNAHPEVDFDVTLDFADPVPCDPARVSQMVSNLLSNAITHGEVGAPIKVMAHRSDRDFVLAVSNAGTPIPEKTQERMFRAFSREEERESQNGLGLGLYISRGIAEAHDGTLDVSSGDGQVCFTFAMPLVATMQGSAVV